MSDMLFNPDLWRYLSMPVITAAVGYVTNVVAIWMMFHPLRFRGISRLGIGWQGVVPRRASKMAGIAVDTITGTLISSADIFNRLDPDAVAERLREPVELLAADVLEDVMRRRHPIVWESLPQPVRAQLKRRARSQAVPVARAVIAELRTHIDALFDLKGMVTHALVRDKRLLNEIFQRTGRVEFRFIGRAGGFFGFLFGLVQMSIWAAWQPWWLLPLFGMFVGGTTNWLALKMIFNPKQPWHVGPWRVQGLFFKRQYEVSTEYAGLIAERILTPERIFEAIVAGPGAERFRAVVERHVEPALVDAMGPARALVAVGFGSREYQALGAAIDTRVWLGVPTLPGHIRDYLEHTVAIRSVLSERLRDLSPARFEAMLRPAFEQDEWLLIVAGGALGLAAGVFQLITLFSSAIA